MAQRPVVPRVVKPRRTTAKHLPIIAIDDGRVFVEGSGVFPYAELANLTVVQPSSLFVAHNVGHIVHDLHRSLQAHPKWQFRMSPVKREIWKPNRERSRSHITHTVCAYFGFQGTKKTPGKWHYPLDPMLFVDRTAHEIMPGDVDALSKLYEWACDVREWCIEHDLAIKPTAGGIAGQLLKDPRFYPDARRKVPKETNRTVRGQLPGNYYRLFTDPDKFHHRVTYLDQTSAHHYAVERVTLPHADKLRAKGYFQSLRDKPWLKNGSIGFERVLKQHGMLYVRLTVPHLAKDSFPLPYMEEQGSHLVCIYTNEIEDILKLGGRIDYIIAAWVSTEVDEGLPRYSRWAQNQLRQSTPNRKGWLKPTLLSTYGVLAARPRPLEFGFNRAKGGEIRHYPIGGARIQVIAKATSRDIEMPTANVIHRAMIEAETRLCSIHMARQMHQSGLRVLAIYADSVFVESGPLPLLPEPWKIEAHLTGLQFINSTSFTSRELTKLPGIHSRDDRERLARARIRENPGSFGMTRGRNLDEHRSDPI